MSEKTSYRTPLLRCINPVDVVVCDLRDQIHSASRSRRPVNVVLYVNYFADII